MGYVQFPTVDLSAVKPLEYTDLEAHVTLCQQRHQVLIDSIDRISKKVDAINEQGLANRRIIVGAFVTILTGTATALITVLISILRTQ